MDNAISTKDLIKAIGYPDTDICVICNNCGRRLEIDLDIRWNEDIGYYCCYCKKPLDYSKDIIKGF